MHVSLLTLNESLQNVHLLWLVVVNLTFVIWNHRKLLSSLSDQCNTDYSPARVKDSSEPCCSSCELTSTILFITQIHTRRHIQLLFILVRNYNVKNLFIHPVYIHQSWPWVHLLWLAPTQTSLYRLTDPPNQIQPTKLSPPDSTNIGHLSCKIHKK